MGTEENKSLEASIDTENLKKETSSTINEVRETLKNVNIKEETEATKGFLRNFLKNPIGEMKQIANAEKAFFETAIILMALWTASILIKEVVQFIDLLSLGMRRGIFSDLLSLIKDTIVPCVGVASLSVIVLIRNKNNKKSLVSIITTIAVAKIPVILASVLSVLTIIGSGISRLTSPFSSVCSVVSAILLYFGLKEIFGVDDDDTFMKEFITIQLLFFGAKFVFRLLGINI